MASTKEHKVFCPKAYEREKAERHRNNNARKAYKEGQKLVAQGKFVRAISSFNDAISCVAEDSTFYVARALCWKSLNDHERAVEDLKEAIKFNHNSQYFLLRALEYRCLNMLPAALSDFSQALTGKEDPQCYLERGKVYFDMKDFREAAKDFSAVLQLLPSHFEALFYRGQCFRNQKKLNDAVADFQKALTIERNNGALQDILGMCYFDLNLHKYAVASFSAAIEVDRKATYYNHRGLASYRLGDFSDALEDFTRAADLDKSNPSYVFSMGNCFLALKQDAKAHRCYDESIKNGIAREPMFYHSRGLAYKVGGEIEKAREQFSHALELDPLYFDSQYELGLINFNGGKWLQAVESFTQILKHETNDKRFYAARARAYQDLQDYENAVADYTLAIQLDPDCAAYFLARGRCLLPLGRASKAIDDLDKAVALGGGSIDPEVWIVRASARRELQQYKEAITDLTTALESSDHSNPELLFSRAQSLYEIEQYAGATDDINSALVTLPGDSRLLYWRGRCHFQQAKYQSCIDDFRKCLPTLSPSLIEECYHLLGCAYNCIKQHQLAIPAFTQALRGRPNCMQWRYERGCAHLLVENYAEAIQDLSKVIEAEPQNLEALLQRAQAYRLSGLFDESSEDLFRARETPSVA